MKKHLENLNQCGVLQNKTNSHFILSHVIISLFAPVLDLNLPVVINFNIFNHVTVRRNSHQRHLILKITIVILNN